MSFWFLINSLIFLLAFVKVFLKSFPIHIVFGLFGVCFFLYNWSRHAVFATIRSDIPRKRKIQFAQLSKKLLPIHKWTGTLAFILVLIHGSLVIHYYGWQLANLKIVSGLVTIFIMSGLILFGWLRYIKTTVARRYIHWTLAYVVFFLIVIHILL